MPPPPASRQVIRSLLNLARTSPTCPCHSCSSGSTNHHVHDVSNAARAIASGGLSRTRSSYPPSSSNWGRAGARGYATPIEGFGEKEYAFEVAASNIRFGEGVTSEVGMDFKNLGAEKVGLYTDPTVGKLLPVKQAVESLEAAGVKYEIFDRCRVEPNQESWQEAIDFAKLNRFTHFLAVGGGSTIDTCKVANLYSCYPEAELLDFVNAPIGKGRPIDKTLKPLIAVPTTAGTGSETTGTAIFDYTPLLAKTGIASRALKPMLGIVDPLNTDSCPTAVHISSGLDVLFHSLESYTAIPYNERTPRPSNPINRPAYQGRNPISDVFSMWALRQTVQYLPRIAKNPNDKEAKSQMLLAATFAGIGFGNAGVHLCHAFSYPISGLNKTKGKYQHPGYQVDHPIVPHGISVALTGPATFNFTAPSSPDRHREAAKIFAAAGAGIDGKSVDIDRLPDADVGMVLHDCIARFLDGLGVPRGLSAIGYKSSDINDLVKGTLPQRRVLDLAPGMKGNSGEEELAGILEGALKF